MIDDLIDRVLGGEEPRDVVDEVTSTGAIATYPKPMAIVRKTRSDRRSRKPKIDEDYASDRKETQRLTWHTFKQLRKTTGYDANSRIVSPKKIDWSAVDDLAAGLGSLGFKWITDDLIAARKYRSTKMSSVDKPGQYSANLVASAFDYILRYQVQIFGNKIIKEVDHAVHEIDRGPENWIHGVGGPQPGGFFWDVTNATSPGDGVQIPPSWPWSKKFRRKYGANTAFNKRPDPGKG